MLAAKVDQNEFNRFPLQEKFSGFSAPSAYSGQVRNIADYAKYTVLNINTKVVFVYGRPGNQYYIQ